MSCGYFPRKNTSNCRAWCRAVESFFSVEPVFRGTPLPLPSESLDWRGFHKNGLQNLDVKELRGQNLDNKRLRPLLQTLSTALPPWISSAFLLGEGKVGCHAVSDIVCGNRDCASALFPRLAKFPYFPLFVLLSGLQSIWQFSCTVLPPPLHGRMWSASISSNLKCFLQAGTDALLLCVDFLLRFVVEYRCGLHRVALLFRLRCSDGKEIKSKSRESESIVSHPLKFAEVEQPRLELRREESKVRVGKTRLYRKETPLPLGANAGSEKYFTREISTALAY